MSTESLFITSWGSSSGYESLFHCWSVSNFIAQEFTSANTTG